MRYQRFFGGVLAMIAIVAVVILYNTRPVRSSDHQDSLTVVARPAADITDVFIYPSPSNPANVVLQMDVDPLIPPSAVGQVALDPSVLYQFRIANGSYNATTGFSATADDQVIQFMATSAGPSQTVNVYGPVAPPQGGTSTSQSLGTLSGNVPFNPAAPATAGILTNGMHVFVGPRADPFFFDLMQFLKIIPDRDYHNHLPGATVPAATAMSFQGFGSATQTSGGVTATNCAVTQASDIFAVGHYNVISIVVEMPKALLINANGSVIGVHATTSTVSGT